MGFYIVTRSIVYSFQLNKKRHYIYTGMSADLWDAKKQRVPKSVAFAWKINDRLEKVEEYIENLKIDFKETGILPGDIDSKIKQICKPEQVNVVDDKKYFVWEYVDQYIKRKKGMKSNGYLKNWPSLRESVKSFSPLLYFDEMNMVWMEAFAKYLASQGISHNTVVGKIAYLRILGRDALKMGQKVAYDFEDYIPKEIKYPVFYLDWDTHLQAMREVILISQLAEVRDRFLFRCNTGMREGEMKGLNPSSFRKKEGYTWMNYYDEKGKKFKDIILSTEATALAEKYNFKFPFIYQHDENVLIKQVGLLAGLTESRIKTTHIGSKVTHTSIPIYELITTHTARRTFARRWYEKKGDMELLSRYLGHSDIKVTRIYIGLADVEASNELFRLMG